MSVAVSSVKYLLVKASLCLEAVERPQWPRLYLLGRSWPGAWSAGLGFN